MIKTAAEHKVSVKEVREKVFGEHVSIESLANQPTVSIQSEADILFTNLNKYHLFEEEHFDRENDFYKEVLYHQHLNTIDFNYHHQYLTEKVVAIKGNIPEGDSPVIYCSFHYGSYAHVSTALRMLDKNFTVVSKQTGGSSIIRWKKEEEAHAENPDYFHHSKTIDPQALDSTFQIYNTLRKGRSVLVYIDVFLNKTEGQGKRNKEFYLFNSKLFIASGIPEISQKTGAPIIPVISERTPKNTLEITFYDSVCNGDTAVENYTNAAFQECFQIFSKHLQKHPEQWDQWQFIHKNLIKTPKIKRRRRSFAKLFKKLFGKGERIAKNATIIFNKSDFQFFQRDEVDYLLNINNYKCFKITSHLTKILKRLNTDNFTVPEVKGALNPTLYNDLVSKKVLKAKETSN